MRLFNRILSVLLVMILVAYSGQLHAQNIQVSQWEHYTKANSPLPSDTVSAIGFDGSGRVWIGTMSDGLAVMNGSNWSVYNDFSKVPSNDISAITYANGSIWIGTSSGLTKTDGSSWTTFTTTNSGISDDGVWSIAQDNNHNLWLGTNWGISKLSLDNHWSSYTDAAIPILPSNHIQSIVSDMNGNIWTSFISAYGMMKFSASNPAGAVLVDQNTISNFPADHVLSIAIDWGGNAWAATYYQGLVRTDGITATVYSKETDANWISDNTRCVAIDQCGHVWVGTDHGAAVYDGSWTIHSLTTEQSINDTVNTIAVDAAGHIWFGTNGGVVIYKPMPQKPILLAPQNAAELITDTVTCKWYWDCPGIIKYWFEIADNPSFINSRIDTISATLTESASRWDTNFVNHTVYYWRIKAKNDMGWGPYSDVWTFTFNKLGVTNNTISPLPVTLSQNFPNPCSDMTTFRFSLRQYERVSLKLYDILGRERASIFEGDLNPGDYSIPFNLPIPGESAVYFYRLMAGDFQLQRTMQIMR